MITRLISHILEEYSTRQKGELNCFNIDICFISVPSDCSYNVRDNKSEDTIEEEEKEDDYDDDYDKFEEENPANTPVREKIIQVMSKCLPIEALGESIRATEAQVYHLCMA